MNPNMPSIMINNKCAATPYPESDAMLQIVVHMASTAVQNTGSDCVLLQCDQNFCVLPQTFVMPSHINPQAVHLIPKKPI